jgi:hypothetical protein
MLCFREWRSRTFLHHGGTRWLKDKYWVSLSSSNQQRRPQGRVLSGRCRQAERQRRWKQHPSCLSHARDDLVGEDMREVAGKTQCERSDVARPLVLVNRFEGVELENFARVRRFHRRGSLGPRLDLVAQPGLGDLTATSVLGLSTWCVRTWSAVMGDHPLMTSSLKRASASAVHFR